MSLALHLSFADSLCLWMYLLASNFVCVGGYFSVDVHVCVGCVVFSVFVFVFLFFAGLTSP
jgi:hypothetical protein